MCKEDDRQIVSHPTLSCLKVHIVNSIIIRIIIFMLIVVMINLFRSQICKFEILIWLQIAKLHKGLRYITIIFRKLAKDWNMDSSNWFNIIINNNKQSKYKAWNQFQTHSINTYLNYAIIIQYNENNNNKLII